ncbi:MAG: FG-GAP-like repeat-containing protein [Pyrinomonadaceae bacterium]
MYKRFTLSVLFVLALFLGMNFTNSVSADKKDKNSDISRALASTTLVISQAYGGGGGTTGTYSFDYVELKNISASPQSLNGLSLYYGSATGQFASMTTNAFALPTGVTLQPGQYYLVQTSTAGVGPPPLPVAPDATTTNLSMSGTNGKVALVNGLAQNSCGAVATPCALPNAQIIDVVAWGTSNNAEGGAATNGGGSLTSTQGNVRKSNGCQDTDNNNADFDIITAPVPRNSATTAAPCSVAPTTDAANDLNGDGRSDYTVVRNVGGGTSGQIRWFYNTSGTADPTVALDWGLANDGFFLLEDFDGDAKDDITVWRSGTGTFYILQSQTMTARIDQFGQTGDTPKVVGDYDGDGKADTAVYRSGANPGDQSTWYYRGSLTPATVTTIPWGQNGDFEAPGDYDGDGKNDFVIQRNNGGGQAAFWRRNSNGSATITVFGTPTDNVVPGDYDGDGKTDFAVARSVGGQWQWIYLASSNSSINYITFGASGTDFVAQGDYNGDGKTDVGVWRASASPGGSFYVWRDTVSGSVQFFTFGQNGDYPVNNWNRH